MALMSPMLTSGERQLLVKISTKSWLRTPLLTTFIGGKMMPSWKISWFDGEIDEGTRPPTSVKWMMAQPKHAMRPFQK